MPFGEVELVLRNALAIYTNGRDLARQGYKGIIARTRCSRSSL
jgi:hypothetical protein